jgi:hypothetical protein
MDFIEMKYEECLCARRTKFDRFGCEVSLAIDSSPVGGRISIGVTVIQVQACRWGDQVFLCNERLKCKRLDHTWYQNEQTSSQVTLSDYNLTAFYGCLDPEVLEFLSAREPFFGS